MQHDGSRVVHIGVGAAPRTADAPRFEVLPRPRAASSSPEADNHARPAAMPLDATSGLCGYRAADGAEVVLSVWEGDAGTAMWTTLDMIVSAGGEGIERVEGLGADAIYSTGDGTLVVSRNGTTVQVAVRLPDKDPAGARPIAEDLGRQIAARL